MGSIFWINHMPNLNWLPWRTGSPIHSPFITTYCNPESFRSTWTSAFKNCHRQKNKSK